MDMQTKIELKTFNESSFTNVETMKKEDLLRYKEAILEEMKPFKEKLQKIEERFIAIDLEETIAMNLQEVDVHKLSKEQWNFILKDTNQIGSDLRWNLSKMILGELGFKNLGKIEGQGEKYTLGINLPMHIDIVKNFELLIPHLDEVEMGGVKGIPIYYYSYCGNLEYVMYDIKDNNLYSPDYYKYYKSLEELISGLRNGVI